ncbi:MAG TPA: hypothetical protein VMZ50_08225, partial [Phycisphaerae bacterium]|nr:hypothetical protein [Phycisphaerae bacterium]
LRNLHRLADRWGDPNAPRKLRDAVADLANLDYRIEWEVSDLTSLRELLPGIAHLLTPVELDGNISGYCSIKSADEETTFHAEAIIPRGTRLNVPGIVEKPAAEECRLALSGTVADPNEPGLRDVDLRMSLGDGQVHVSDFNVSLRGAEGQRTIELDGRLNVEQIGTVLPHLPALSEWTDSARGAAAGRFAMRFAPDKAEGAAVLDLGDLELAIRDVFAKPEGEELTAEFAFQRRDGLHRGALRVRFPNANLDANLVLSGGDLLDPRAAGELTWAANVADAGWLKRACPRLGEFLGADRISGSVQSSGWARWDEKHRDANIDFDATGLEYVSAGPIGRVKLPGVPAGGAISLRVRSDPEEGFGAATVAAVADAWLAETRLRCETQATADLDSLASGIRPEPRVALRNLRAKIDASWVLDPALLHLVPELGDLAQRHEIAGSIRTNLSLEDRGQTLAVECDLDATALSVGRIGQFGKPAGLPASGQAKLILSPDLSDVRVNQLHGRVGDVYLTAAGRGRVVRGADARPAIRLREGRLALSTRKAHTLPLLAAALKDYELAGDVFVELEWRDDPRGITIPRARASVGELSAKYRGKKLTLSGGFDLENLWLPDKGLPSVQRVRTDKLEFRIGDNHGWLIGDLTGLPSAPSGTLTVLAEYLDDKDLEDWLAPPGGLKGAGELTEKSRAELHDLADKLIRDAKKALADSDLTLRISADRFRTYDAPVGQFYMIRNADLAATVNRRLAEVRFAGGLNGGTYRTHYEVDLSADAPAVKVRTDVSDVIAAENIRPQFRRFFPGNTPYGSFSRAEQVARPLREVVANTIDPRFGLTSVGTAKIIANDGVVEGRAAPHFVAAIFPGLNLATYRYNKMTGFATFRADGVTENDMIFNGRVYDMDWEGTTDADNLARYEIGLFLLSPPQSP